MKAIKKKGPTIWKDLETQRATFDAIGKRLGVKQYQDWYQIAFVQVNDEGGGSLVKSLYGGSLIRALQTIYSCFVL